MHESKMWSCTSMDLNYNLLFDILKGDDNFHLTHETRPLPLDGQMPASSSLFKRFSRGHFIG